jgi:hypothetical protein
MQVGKAGSGLTHSGVEEKSERKKIRKKRKRSARPELAAKRVGAALRLG